MGESSPKRDFRSEHVPRIREHASAWLDSPALDASCLPIDTRLTVGSFELRISDFVAGNRGRRKSGLLKIGAAARAEYGTLEISSPRRSRIVEKEFVCGGAPN